MECGCRDDVSWFLSFCVYPGLSLSGTTIAALSTHGPAFPGACSEILILNCGCKPAAGLPDCIAAGPISRAYVPPVKRPRQKFLTRRGQDGLRLRTPVAADSLLLRPAVSLLLDLREPADICPVNNNYSKCGVSVSSLHLIKQHKRALIQRHAHADNLTGLMQSVTTLVPLAILWWMVVLGAAVSYWLTAALVLLISLFTLRVLVLMHECGHGSLFHGVRLNRAFGFVFGVLSGMPQFVWSQHHDFHHANNGNWQKYRGPLTTPSVDEYAAMSGIQQCLYRGTRNVLLAPLGGFVYLIFNPRFTWLKGSLGLAWHLLKRKALQPEVSLRVHAAAFVTRYWNSSRQYWHMFWNNCALLGIWVLMCWVVGPALFFTVYLISVSLAGGAGIALFTVQHNFEHSYATDTERWDYDQGALAGTSFLILPGWLNWFTANIAYHHIHHLSAKIPNYRLVACHNENQQLFADVVRIRLREIPRALKCIIWDTRAQRIISVAEYLRQR